MRNNLSGGVIALVVVAMLLFGTIGYFTAVKEAERVGCTVSGKDRTRDSDGNSDARIYTDNCGTFKVEDSAIKVQFNSADLYGMIKVGETYDFTTTGFRLGLFSVFPNIIKAVPSDS